MGNSIDNIDPHKKEMYYFCACLTKLGRVGLGEDQLSQFLRDYKKVETQARQNLGELNSFLTCHSIS